MMLFGPSLAPVAGPASAAGPATLPEPMHPQQVPHAPAPSDLQRRQAFIDARVPLDREFQAASRLRASDPARYAAAARSWVQRGARLADAYPGMFEAMVYRRELAAAAEGLAPTLRFTLRDAAAAADLYRQAIDLYRNVPGEESLALPARIGLADTLRFDLRDGSAALAQYREMQKLLEPGRRPAGETEAILHRAAQAWLRAELAWLTQGSRYAGVPDREALAVVAMLLDGGAESFSRDDPALRAMWGVLSQRPPDDGERREFANGIEALSPSQGRIAAVFGYLPLLQTPERIADFMRRHDPAGFLSAAVFAAWHELAARHAAGGASAGRPPGLQMLGWSAQERSLMQRAERSLFDGRRADARPVDRRADTAPGPDLALASPESTWKTFLAALRWGELAVAWKCTTPGMRYKFEPAFSTMGKPQLRAMADAATGFRRTLEHDAYVEATVVMAGGRAGIVQFVKYGREWLIAEM